MGESSPAMPIAASAISFGATHLAMRHGPVHRRLTKMYARRKEKGLLQPNANPPQLAAQAGSRLLNEIHNIMVVPLAMMSMFDGRLNNDRVGGTTPLCSFLTLLTAGYFCTETLIICNNFEEHGIEPLAHATVCIAFFVLSALTQKMQWFVPRVLFFEFSTPLVHLRWLLSSMGLGDTKLYKVNGIAMMGAFFVCRVAWGTKLIISFLKRSHLYVSPTRGVGTTFFRIIFTAAIGISGLNYYWFYKMCRGAFKVLRRKRTPTSSREPSAPPDALQSNGATPEGSSSM